jgi:hypothetical protein
VNEREEGLDNKGLFRVKVPVMRGDTTVRVVAVDRQGKRASAEFMLIPEQPSTAVADAEESPAPEASGPLLFPLGSLGPTARSLAAGGCRTDQPSQLDL